MVEYRMFAPKLVKREYGFRNMSYYAHKLAEKKNIPKDEISNFYLDMQTNEIVIQVKSLGGFEYDAPEIE